MRRNAAILIAVLAAAVAGVLLLNRGGEKPEGAGASVPAPAPAKAPAPEKAPPAPSVAGTFRENPVFAPLPPEEEMVQVDAEIESKHLNKDFIVLISIAKGIGRSPLLGGMTWSFGDDWVWQFRKVDKRVLIIRKNVRFKAKSGSRHLRIDNPARKTVNLIGQGLGGL